MDADKAWMPNVHLDNELEEEGSDDLPEVDDEDDDDELRPTEQSVIDVLGFDPLAEDDDTDED